MPFWKKTTKREILGYVVSPTGNVVITDFGYLYLWCHDEPPVMLEGVLSSPQDTERANNAVDLHVIGSDAVKAGQLFNRNWHPEYLYDILRENVGELRQMFDEVVRNNHLEASLVVLEERVTHRKRVDLALEFGGGTGEIKYHGIWATVLGNLPKNEKLPVYGERMSQQEWRNRWRWVTLEVRPKLKTDTSAHLGYVMVDYGRMMCGDVDSLATWAHGEPLDGNADFVFWGKDASILAERMKANDLGAGLFGWQNVPVQEAVELAQTAKEARDQSELVVAGDFRPHSHDYLLMEKIRSSPTESGMLELGGATLCGFTTTWGDGIFPVLGEFDSNQQLIRVRIDLGSDATVERMEKLINRAKQDD